MDEVLTFAQIQARFNGEVLLEDPVTEPNYTTKSGKVVWHSKECDEVYRKAIELRPKRCAIWYCGDLPKDMEFALTTQMRGREVA